MLVIEFLQGFLGDRWLSFFLTVTELGGEATYIVLLSLYFWLVSPTQGRQLGLVLTLSIINNNLLKTVFEEPRPYVLNPAILTPEALRTTDDFSFPSGHAQGVTTVWGTIACFQQKAWVWMGAIAVIFLVSLSRVYLGVHFPIDIFGGILLGIIWITIGFWIDRNETKIHYRLRQKLLIWLGGSILAIAFPQLGALLGVFCGFFTVDGSQHKRPRHWRSKITLGMGGLILVIGFYLLLKKLSVWMPEFLPVDYARYLAIALGITEGVPWLWRRVQPVK